jgi:hypothetical protein
MHFSYTSLNGYFAGSFITTYLTVLIILPARKNNLQTESFACASAAGTGDMDTDFLDHFGSAVCGGRVAAAHKASPVM